MTQADSVHSTPPTNTSANNPLESPEKPQDSLYLPTPVTPEEAFQAIGRLRKAARAEIERLIDWLDSTENHMEREPDDEGDEAELEPSLGSFDRMVDQSKAWRQGNLLEPPEVDAELDDCDDEEADEPEIGADDEPSLCGINAECKGNDEDREQDLGSFDRMMDQTKFNRTADLKYSTFGGWPVEGGEVDLSA